MTTTLTAEQHAMLAKLKSCFPFRIVWGAVDPQSGEFECRASFTKRQANDKARQGWAVFIAGQNTATV